MKTPRNLNRYSNLVSTPKTEQNLPRHDIPDIQDSHAEPRKVGTSDVPRHVHLPNRVGYLHRVKETPWTREKLDQKRVILNVPGPGLDALSDTGAGGSWIVGRECDTSGGLGRTASG